MGSSWNLVIRNQRNARQIQAYLNVNPCTGGCTMKLYKRSVIQHTSVQSVGHLGLKEFIVVQMVLIGP